MSRARVPTPAPPPPGQALRRIGCVSYLNAKPLIEGLEGQPDPQVRFDVPSRLLEDLQSGQVDIALCPVIDYFRSPVPLEIVPVGGIGCQGPTLTVRLFSRVPIEQITTIHADTDSHTSIALLGVLLAERYGLRPTLIDYNAREQVVGHRLVPPPQTLLLIGDKVVTDGPTSEQYPHQMDLGEAWHEWTGRPFVFAIWMTRAGTELGNLPAVLEAQRIINAGRIEPIVDRHAASHGWPRDLALRYLGHLLRYSTGSAELQAIEHFASMAQRVGVLAKGRELMVRRT